MRFRKSVSITKGVKLNLSKTGASVTVGKGPVSLNVGNKGAYVNWSVPGTGVYDRVRIDKFIMEKLGIGKSAKAETKGKTSSKTAKSAKQEPSRPSDEELERIAQEQAFFTMHELAPDVERKASADPLDAETAENDVEDWLSDAEAPVPFCVQTQAVPDERAVMVDLDLPEIEDMPSDKLAEMADGSIKIKAKAKKEQLEDYRTCVFGLGVYVAANVFAIVPQAERVLVSAYTQRRSAKTGDSHDAFIYSVVFERSKFTKGYQKRAPQEFCGGMKSRFYVLASGEMKEIEPYAEGDITA